MDSNKSRSESSKEKAVLLVYGLYTVIMSSAALLVNWQAWVAPLILAGMTLCIIIYLKQFRSFYFRAAVTSVMCWMDVSIYFFMTNDFLSVLPIMAAVTVLTALYGIPDVIHIGTIIYSLHVIYNLFFDGDIWADMNFTSGVKIVSGIFSVYVVITVIYFLIKIRNETKELLVKNLETISAAERSKDDFMANICHEVRTPINTVCGLSEAVLSRKLPEDIMDNITDIRNSGNCLLSMFNDIFDFTDLKNGRMKVVSNDYNITSVVNDIINMTESRTADKKLELIVDFDARIPAILKGDDQKIRRAVLNIIDNAVKFTNDGGVIVRIRARREEYGVNLIISVRDTGIGMNGTSVEKLFTSYNQADTKRSRREEGLGLGLPIAKAVVNKMGGFISIQSEPGNGTEVQLVIPQGVVIERPSVSLNDPGKIKVMLYIDMNKYRYSVIRDGYAENIAHIVEGLGINYIRCLSLSDVKRRIVKESFSHVFLSWEEYCEDKEFFEKLSDEVRVVLVLDRDHKESLSGSKLMFVYKPFYVLSIAAVLNGQYDGSPGRNRKVRFTAPDASVLVVDDNPMNLKVIEGLLRPYLINVHVAGNGRQALEMMDSLQIDMVFMDHMMPEMDGIETFRELRRKPGAYFRNVPVIALTANAIGGARDMFMIEGFSDYITKPIELSSLERVLCRFIPNEKIIKYSDIAEHEYMEEAVSVSDKELNIEGVDVQLGIGYCSGNIEDYIDIVKIYHEIGVKRIDEIRQFFNEKDWENYTILVHSLKSTSLNIGAVKLSKMAKRLESAAKSKDENVIAEENDTMLSEYERVIEAIKNCPMIFNGENDKSSAENSKRCLRELTDSELSESLEKLRECIESYEIESVEKYLEESSCFGYKGLSLGELLSSVKSKAVSFDFMGAGEELARLIERLGGTE